MAAYAERAEEIVSLGARVVALSVDSLQQSAAFRRKYELPYVLLCDTDKTVVIAWNALNSAERGGIAYPSTWVIDSTLRVQFCMLERKASRVDPEPIVQLLRGELDEKSARTLSRITPAIGASIRWGANTVRRFLRRRR